MASVPVHIPIHIRVTERRGSPPDVTVEPTCVHAKTRDILEWDLQGGGRFRIEVVERRSPFGSAFQLASASDGCCSAMVAAEAEPGTYRYKLDGDAIRLTPISSTPPVHFAVSGAAEVVIG